MRGIFASTAGSRRSTPSFRTPRSPTTSPPTSSTSGSWQLGRQASSGRSFSTITRSSQRSLTFSSDCSTGWSVRGRIRLVVTSLPTGHTQTRARRTTRLGLHGKRWLWQSQERRLRRHCVPAWTRLPRCFFPGSGSEQIRCRCESLNCSSTAAGVSRLRPSVLSAENLRSQPRFSRARGEGLGHPARRWHREKIAVIVLD